MTSAQKVIKYCAIAFAILIIVNIIGAIYFGLSVFSGALGLRSNSKVTEELHDLDLNGTEVFALDIDLLSANLTIKKGEQIKVQTNSNDITIKQKRTELLVKEKEYRWHLKNENKEVVIYLPEMMFDKVTIETGAGKINIDEINTKEIDFDFGAGKVDIRKLNASHDAEFDGGAGEVNILSGSIRNLDLDLGVGKFFLKSTLVGNTKIDAGVGEVDLRVLGNEEDYRVKVSKGIGSIRLNGNSVNDNTTYGMGDNKIEIDGGVGSLSLAFER